MVQKDFLYARLEEAAYFARNKGIAAYLDFYEPSVQLTVEREIARFPDCDATFFGGHEYTQRKMLCIHPKGMEPEEREFPIGCILIEKNREEYSHQDVLGALMGLGIEREKTGDINITEDFVQIFVSEPIAEFVEENLTKISRYDVKAGQIPLSGAHIVKPEFQKMDIIVPSMRLDAVVHSVFRMSRSESAAHVKAENVRINHVPAKKPSVMLKENDIVSVRGKGKFIVSEQTGVTKKNNIRLHILRFR